MLASGVRDWTVDSPRSFFTAVRSVAALQPACSKSSPHACGVCKARPTISLLT